ncbi:hypothetical protein [Variovorax sp. OV329]|uniref:hypothetical protein n=1 Tax=Variovorax sp. OV329 TaxID=1882825 RepID=UPI0008EDA14B|nr:hypothetical protein [Variovorax sp. OV329]SFM69123.1 hypothetical protein SAMN05444747_107337 [Variovorax sp. OV329]
MNKLLLTALLSALGTWTVMHAIEPVDAAEPPGQARFEPSIDSPAMPPVVRWPAPQAPFESTPITPFETVGAAHFEPF